MTDITKLPQLASAYVKAQAAFTPAVKNCFNETTGSAYADFESISEAIRQPLIDNHLSFIQRVVAITNSAAIETVIMHDSGEIFPCGVVAVPVAVAKDPQAFGSAMMYARRYSLEAAFGVARAKSDDDGQGAMLKTNFKKGPLLPEVHIIALRKALLAKGKLDERMMDWLKTEAPSLGYMTPEEATRCAAALKITLPMIEKTKEKTEDVKTTPAATAATTNDQPAVVNNKVAVENAAKEIAAEKAKTAKKADPKVATTADTKPEFDAAAATEAKVAVENETATTATAADVVATTKVIIAPAVVVAAESVSPEQADMINPIPAVAKVRAVPNSPPPQF
jgi:hypothetical protein